MQEEKQMFSFAAIFQSEEQFDPQRGYCLIDSTQPGGITRALTDDNLNRNFYIPSVFPELDLYIEPTSHVNGGTAVSPKA